MNDIEKNEIGIVVDDGSITVPIRNTEGDEVGKFKFRPTDFNIVKRYNEIANKFDDVIQPLIDANINADGSGSDDASIELLNEAEKRLFNLVDYLFDGNMADAFFGKMHAFSLVDGKFYCENVLNAVGEFISQKFDSEIKKVSSRVEKYTHGYRTGKHKDGKK